MDWKTETEFLLHCLGTETNKIEIAKLERLSVNDWDGIIKQSLKHRVAPMLYDRFKKIGILDKLPTEVMQKLRRGYLSNAEMNIRRYHELTKVFKAFQDADISVIVLKGVVLAELIYRNIALRPMSDVDLTVKTEDTRRMDRLLIQLGYKPLVLPLSEHHRQWTPLGYSNGIISIDVRSGRPSDLPTSDLWANAAAVTLASANILILGPADLLLHLCLHLYRHFREGWTYLIWWCDIAEVLKCYEKDIDWDYVIRVIKKYHLEKRIYWVLNLVYEWSGGRIPPDVIRQIKCNRIDVSINDTLDFGKQSLGSQEQGPQEIYQIQGKELYLFLSSISRIPSIFNKLYHILRSIFPSKEFITHRYSVKRPYFIYFYYLVRLGNVSKKVVKAMCQLPIYLINKYKIEKKKFR